MELSVDLRQPVERTMSSVEPTHVWIVRPAAVDDGPLTEYGGRPYSFLTDCECPGFCLRDHKNE